eukprot:37411-Prorocentrum_minimum.AAC.1
MRSRSAVSELLPGRAAAAAAAPGSPDPPLGSASARSGMAASWLVESAVSPPDTPLYGGSG